MNTNEVSSVQLVSTEKIASLRFVDRIRKRKSRFSRSDGPDPLAAEYHRQLLKMEYALRAFIARSVPCIPERILSYTKKPSRPGGKRPRIYHEIDFVTGTAENPRAFLEFKTSQRNQSPKGARRQILTTLTIARKRWPRLRGLLVFVFMGNLYKLDGIPPARLRNPAALPGLAGNPPADLKAVWIDGGDLVGESIQLGILPPDYPEKLVRSRKEMENPLEFLPKEDGAPFGSLEKLFSNPAS